MITRSLAGVAALALAAGAQAAISASFAAGSANVERLFEIHDATVFGAELGATTPLAFRVVEGAEVDLIFNMGQELGLMTQRAGFEGMFFVDFDVVGTGIGPAIGFLNGSFRFFNPEKPAQTLLTGFVSDGIGFLVVDFGEGDNSFIAGSLVDPTASYFVNDPINPSLLGFPGGGMIGDFALTLTNFIQFEDDELGFGDPIGAATGSFSASFVVPSTGTGVLSAVAFGVIAGRRRR